MKNTDKSASKTSLKPATNSANASARHPGAIRGKLAKAGKRLGNRAGNGSTRMDIMLHELTLEDKERFVDGFTEAALIDFPTFDADEDNLRVEPWSRPWASGPVMFTVHAQVPPTPQDMGRKWFWVVRDDMLKEAASEILPAGAAWGACL